ncbi:hypothetical protein [Streptomyces iconiensis]|uniref:Uncharacterized protein n=1 Tax=Streptomyces iconiensis TaxID=1384038 RepID=A0ABT6ZYP5_9ACTN|nr:hypothetical protein [Streptomyces iconiensis]MDJ1134194.1 hypothetical protein [Streptomyces iconiensis]
MLDPEPPERITVRRAELDELEEQLAERLTEARAERDELAVSERVLGRMTGQRSENRSDMVNGRCGNRPAATARRRPLCRAKVRT